MSASSISYSMNNKHGHEIHFHEIHFHEIHFHEIHFHEIHFHEIHFHEIHFHESSRIVYCKMYMVHCNIQYKLYISRLHFKY